MEATCTKLIFSIIALNSYHVETLYFLKFSYRLSLDKTQVEFYLSFLKKKSPDILGKTGEKEINALLTRFSTKILVIRLANGCWAGIS